MTIVAAAAGLLDREYGSSVDVPPDLLEATGVGWAAGAVVDHLRAAAERYLTQRTALGSGLGF